MTADLVKRNRINALDILQTLSENDTIHLQETCILAWGHLGKILPDEELNLVLLRLVKYLGHTNPVISGTAFNEILKNLGEASGMEIDINVEKMLSAFWSNIALEAVQDLLIRPQTTQLMADLLQTTVPEFLVMTQAYTLPWLVLTKRTDVIKRISQARNDDETWKTCMAPSNLNPILALLLIQSTQDTEIFVMSLLKNVSSRFKELDLTDLLRVEPASNALHLLKAAGDADESKRSKVRVVSSSMTWSKLKLSTDSSCFAVLGQSSL